MGQHDSIYRSYVRQLRAEADGSVHLTLEEIETLLAERIDQWNREILEKGIQIGRQEGRQEGREEGRKEGRQQGAARVLLRQLIVKFGPLSPEIEERVGAADYERLLDWSVRFLTAERLEDVFSVFTGDL